MDRNGRGSPACRRLRTHQNRQARWGKANHPDISRTSPGHHPDMGEATLQTLLTPSEHLKNQPKWCRTPLMTCLQIYSGFATSADPGESVPEAPGRTPEKPGGRGLPEEVWRRPGGVRGGRSGRPGGLQGGGRGRSGGGGQGRPGGGQGGGREVARRRPGRLPGRIPGRSPRRIPGRSLEVVKV